jgi:hypothetical protein
MHNFFPKAVADHTQLFQRGGLHHAPRSQIPKSMISQGEKFSEFPCSVAAFVVNSEPHTGARPSVRLCVGLKAPYISSQARDIKRKAIKTSREDFFCVGFLALSTLPSKLNTPVFFCQARDITGQAVGTSRKVIDLYMHRQAFDFRLLSFLWKEL